MASAAEPVHRNLNSPTESRTDDLYTKIPILPSSAGISSMASSGEPIETSQSGVVVSMGPPVSSSPSGERNNNWNLSGNVGEPETSVNDSTGPIIPSSVSSQPPKVIQTAFIHKLYNMLEDQSIKHLISWSNTNESFVMSPSNEFSKVLSSYFKHTNISSFVRQLNMYGFHKVSDVFHAGSPDSPLWEFKHGNGSFKRGDILGLREIRRRASRHALIQRETYPSGPKFLGPHAGAQADQIPDPMETRITNLERNLYDMQEKIARYEDGFAYMTSKYQSMMEGLSRCHQWNLELSKSLMGMIRDPENPVYKDVSSMQKDIAHQQDVFRSLDDNHQKANFNRQPFIPVEVSAPLSPRQLPQEGNRLPSMNQGLLRPLVPSHAPISPGSYGPHGGPPSQPPSSLRNPSYNYLTAPQHRLSLESSPNSNLYRRHTTADIRLHGSQYPRPSHSPYASGHDSTKWPSPPHRTPAGDHQQLRDELALYQLPKGTQQQVSTYSAPSQSNDKNLSSDVGWSSGGARYSLPTTDTAGPTTRRSSMASNVHSLLNPTAERSEEEDRKRKRLS